MRSGIRKSAAAVLVLAVLCSVFAGCHGSVGADAFAIPEEFDTEGQYTVTFWAKNDTNRTQVAIYRKAIADFQEYYPNITVNLRLYTDYGKIYNDVISNIATNTTPNVCITYPDHIATYLTGSDTVAALDDLMKDARFGLGGSEVRFDAPKAEEIVPEFLRECRIGEHTYAMPYMRSTEALYINEDLVNKLGYEVPDVPTWDFVWEVSEKAMEQEEDGTFKVNGQKVLIPFIYKSTDNMMISMLKQLDAPYSTDDGEILIFSDTTKELLQEIYRHGQSRAFFVWLADFLGREATVEELRDDIDPDLNFVWRVTLRDAGSYEDWGMLLDVSAQDETEDWDLLSNVVTPLVSDWDMGAVGTDTIAAYDQANVQMQVTDPLASWGDALVECVINRYRPAHTTVHFAYA